MRGLYHSKRETSATYPADPNFIDTQTDAAGGVISYTYDQNRKRTKTEYIYSGDTLAGQITGGERIVCQSDAQGAYIGLIYNGTEYSYLKNLQGDVTAISNPQGP